MENRRGLGVEARANNGRDDGKVAAGVVSPPATSSGLEGGGGGRLNNEMRGRSEAGLESEAIFQLFVTMVWCLCVKVTGLG
jgi:hypothetical protein